MAAGQPGGGALQGIRVLDFSTLLPGPMCTLLLAEAGADVIKIEKPGGEDMRRYAPVVGPDSAHFVLLNRGKRSLVLNLKDPAQRAKLEPLLATADVLVEQFRPGVMSRLGLDYATLSARYPRLIYCAITGYGQTGPRAQTAAHDLNYAADAGVLGNTAQPGLPPALVADIAGGAYPAFANIALALLQRERTGKGCHLDVAMAENLWPFQYAALASIEATGAAPEPGQGITAGGSPRYQVYRCADGQYLAVAPLEEKFWQTFCQSINLPSAMRHANANPALVQQAVADCLAQHPAAHWLQRLEPVDACVVAVLTPDQARVHPQFAARDVFGHRVTHAHGKWAALPVPVAPPLRQTHAQRGYAELGASTPIDWLP